MHTQISPLYPVFPEPTAIAVVEHFVYATGAGSQTPNRVYVNDFVRLSIGKATGSSKYPLIVFALAVLGPEIASHFE